MRLMAEAVEDPRSNEDPNNAGNGEKGEDDEFGGVFIFRGAVREKLQFAFLPSHSELVFQAARPGPQQGPGLRATATGVQQPWQRTPPAPGPASAPAVRSPARGHLPTLDSSPKRNSGQQMPPS